MTAFPKPSRKDRLADEALAREDRIFRRAELRHDAIVRAGARCELCGAEGYGELHHILSGSGRRSQAERLDTVILLCPKHHHGWHQGDGLVLSAAYAWASRHGYQEAKEAIERRLQLARAAKYQALSI